MKYKLILFSRKLLETPVSSGISEDFHGVEQRCHRGFGIISILFTVCLRTLGPRTLGFSV